MRQWVEWALCDRESPNGWMSHEMRVKEGDMPKDPGLEKLSIYIPQKKMAEKPVERLMKLGKQRDRSINYLVVEAILQYVQREESSN